MSARETTLILGATSGIARALVRVMAERGCRLILAARNQEELDRIAADLRTRYQSEVFVEPFDALAFDQHAEFLERCLQHADGRLDGVVLCYGYLTDQDTTQSDFEAARRTIDVNFLSPVSILGPIANAMEQQKHGTIAVLSSVAGDRGRQSNYTYGSSKAGLSAWLQGLRNRLHPSGVHVLTVKPGFVDTAMIQGRANPNSPLVASPEKVAGDIDRAFRKKKHVLYTPWFWRLIMTAVCLVPESIFKRLKL